MFFQSKVITITTSPNSTHHIQNTLTGYIEYIKHLPAHDDPEVFGMHNNADMTFLHNEIRTFFNTISRMQRAQKISTIESNEKAILERTEALYYKIPNPWDVEEVIYPVPLLLPIHHSLLLAHNIIFLLIALLLI